MALFHTAQRRRGALFFNWGLVMIAIVTLSAAFILLAAKEERISQQSKIGERQFGLYNAYQDGESVLDTLDGVGKRSAERAVHDLALSGGTIEETLAASACTPKKTAHGTPVWVDRDTECFPEDYTIGFMTLYDRSIADYFGAGALPFGKPGYTHFLEFEGSPSRQMEVLSRSLNTTVLDLTNSSRYYLKGGDFDPNDIEAFAEHIHELEYAGRDSTAYYVDVPAASTVLAEIGEWMPPVAGAYSGLCYYCNRNKELFLQYYPQEFEQSGCVSGSYTRPVCCQGTCPPGALVLNVPYHNQCSFPNSGDATPCYSGCGTTSTMMVLEAAGLGSQDIYTLWEAVGTSSAGTGRESIESYLSGLGILDSTGYDIPVDQIGAHILAGHPILMNPLQLYNDERNCYRSGCTWSGDPVIGGHYFVVVGITPDGDIIIHDPYPGQRNQDPLPGQDERFLPNIIIRKDTLQRMYASDGRTWYAIVVPKVDLRPETAEPEEEGAQPAPLSIEEALRAVR